MDKVSAAAEEDHSDLKNSALRGVRWSAALNVALQVIQYGSSIALARLIEPSAFGLVAMLAVVTGFAATLADLGFGSAIIQRKVISREQLDTAFWSSTLLGIVMAFMTVFLAPLLSAFFNEPDLTQLARVAAISFIVNSLILVPRANLVRKLDIRRMVAIDTAGTVISIVASLTIAVWILVELLSTACRSSGTCMKNRVISSDTANMD